MQFQKETSEASVSIKAYQPGSIKLNIGSYESPVFLVNGELHEFDGATTFEELTAEKLVSNMQEKPEILIIGTGAEHQMLSAELTKIINEMGVAVEAMASRQACHTYQVLTFEQRRVSVLIYP